MASPKTIKNRASKSRTVGFWMPEQYKSNGVNKKKKEMKVYKQKWTRRQWNQQHIHEIREGLKNRNPPLNRYGFPIHGLTQKTA